MAGDVRPICQRRLCHHVDLRHTLLDENEILVYCAQNQNMQCKLLYNYSLHLSRINLQLANTCHTKIPPYLRLACIIPVEPTLG